MPLPNCWRAILDPGPLLDRLLDDEGITAGLDEAEAMVLIQSLSARIRKLAAAISDEQSARKQVDDICRAGRKLSEVVATFRDAGEATARTTAARVGLSWPKNADTPASLLRSLLTTV